MFNIKDYQKLLGSQGVKSVTEVEFQVLPADVSEQKSNITHIAHESLPIFDLHTIPSEQERRVSYCQNFFAEVADKLEVSALQQVPAVVIPKDWVKKVREVTGKYLRRIYGGEEKYLPYPDAREGVTLKEKKKMVLVKLAVGIHTQHKHPQLFWLVIIEALAEKPDNPEMFVGVCEIEKVYFE